MDRRTFLGGAGGLGLAAAAGLAGNSSALRAAHAVSSRIKDENAKPGTTDWLLTHTRIDPKTQYRCPWIEGYCSRTSAAAGDTIELKISTNPAAKFTIDLFRLEQPGLPRRKVNKCDYISFHTPWNLPVEGRRPAAPCRFWLEVGGNPQRASHAATRRRDEKVIS